MGVLIKTSLLIRAANVHHGTPLIVCDVWIINSMVLFVCLPHTFHINIEVFFTSVGHFDQSGIHFVSHNGQVDSTRWQHYIETGPFMSSKSSRKHKFKWSLMFLQKLHIYII